MEDRGRERPRVPVACPPGEAPTTLGQPPDLPTRQGNANHGAASLSIGASPFDSDIECVTQRCRRAARQGRACASWTCCYRGGLADDEATEGLRVTSPALLYARKCMHIGYRRPGRRLHLALSSFRH